MKTLEDVLEEIVPKPDPDFVADMEWRMQRGFPSTGRKAGLPRVALPQLRPRAWAAVAASAALAVLVSVSLLGGDGKRDEQPIVAASGAAKPELDQNAQRVPAPASEGRALSRPLDDAAGGGATALPSPPQGENIAPRARTRFVERSAQLTLAADPDDFDGLADSIFRTADRHDGFVLKSSFNQGEDGTSGGFFELRVPSADLQRTLDDLSALATVRARSESGNDVTAPFVSLRDRLRTAEAERKSLLRRLELAFTDTAAQAIRHRLAIVGRKITSLRADLRSARERTQYATIVVELVDKHQGAASGSDTDRAFDDAVGSLEDVMNFLIRALGVLVPVGATALVVWLGASYWRRRARERALA